jgi:hypothetical protein
VLPTSPGGSPVVPPAPVAPSALPAAPVAPSALPAAPVAPAVVPPPPEPVAAARPRRAYGRRVYPIRNGVLTYTRVAPLIAWICVFILEPSIYYCSTLLQSCSAGKKKRLRIGMVTSTNRMRKQSFHEGLSMLRRRCSGARRRCSRLAATLLILHACQLQPARSLNPWWLGSSGNSQVRKSQAQERTTTQKQQGGMTQNSAGDHSEIDAPAAEHSGGPILQSPLTNEYRPSDASDASKRIGRRLLHHRRSE